MRAAEEQHIVVSGVDETVPLWFGNGFRVSEWTPVFPDRFDQELMRLWPVARRAWMEDFYAGKTGEQAVWWVEQSYDGVRSGIMSWEEAQAAVRASLSVWGDGKLEAEEYLQDIREALPKVPNDALLVIHIEGDSQGHPALFLAIVVERDGKAKFVTGDDRDRPTGWVNEDFSLNA